MYARDMRNSDGKSAVSEGGSGDHPSSSDKKARDTTPSSTDNDDFLFGYGHYGDPHSFAVYQLILLLIDFIFNWTMDLTHEYPLAVLVIFVFQSLAIIINLILYIMASANQTMQVGLHKRVTIHHWLNLGISLLYMILTGWWFIWALRKSWPSVSDQFSFTWPAAGLQNASSLLPPIAANKSSLFNRGNVIRRSTIPKNVSMDNKDPSHFNDEIIKEHYTLWSNGFIALYVTHRTVAILYYFIYLRATFLVLNTPEIERFIENKKDLVERFWEARNTATERSVSKSGRRKRGILTNAYPEEGDGGGPSYPPFSLGYQDYLAESSKFLMEGEALRQESQRKTVPEKDSSAAAVKSNKNKRQMLSWADDNVSKSRKEKDIKDQQGGNDDYDENSGGGGGSSGDMEPKMISVRKPRPPKPRRRRSHERAEVEDNEEKEKTVTTRYLSGDRDDEKEEDYNGAGYDGGGDVVKIRPRERTQSQPQQQRKKTLRRSSREEIEENGENAWI